MIPCDPDTYNQLPPELRAKIESVHPEMGQRLVEVHPGAMDRSDVEMIFRTLMQLARYFAKKYNFTIKPWPEK